MALYSISRLPNRSATALGKKKETKLINSTLRPVAESSMTEKGFLETHDLEAWVVRNREILVEGLTLDDNEEAPEVMIITTQFNRWGAGGKKESGKELDILALTSRGDLLVVELKRGRDRDIHLQAITYAAMCASFTYKTLIKAHANWLKEDKAKYSRQDESSPLEELADQPVLDKAQETTDNQTDSVDAGTEEIARKAISEFLGGIADEDAEVEIPQIVLIGEEFSPETITTVLWLSELAPKLQFSCIEYTLNDFQNEEFVSFNRVWPVIGWEDRKLRPIVAREENHEGQKVRSARTANTVKALVESNYIPEGTPVFLNIDLLTMFKPEGRDHLRTLLESSDTINNPEYEHDASKIRIRWTNGGTPCNKAFRVSLPDGEVVSMNSKQLWERISEEAGYEDSAPQVAYLLYVNGKSLLELRDEMESATK